MTHGNGPQGPQWGPHGSQGPQPQQQWGYPPQQPQQPEKKKGGKGKWIAIIVGLLIVLGMCSVATSGEDESAPATNGSTSSEVAPIPDGGPVAEEPEVEEPDVPREFQNALRSAQSYVDIMSFSYQGLYDQLTSEYADNYPAEAAQYAVDNVEVDWNAEAVEAAEGYLEIMPFSREELIDQLTSEYGDNFTLEQATNAVNQVY